MNTGREKLHTGIYEALAAASICLLPYSRFLSSLSIILLAVNWIIEGNFKSKFSLLIKNIPALLMIGFFLWAASGIFITNDKSICGFEIQKKLPFLVLGIVLGSIDIFNTSTARRLLGWFTTSVFCATVFCFLGSAIHYSHNHSIEDFFYHSLGSPLNFHAVYFSAYIFMAVVFLITEILSGKWQGLRLAALIALLTWLSFFLILLASKLIIAVFLVSILFIFVFYFRRFYSLKPALVICAAIFATSLLILLTKNPISKRFEDISNPKISFLDNNNEHYNTANTFDGLTFRVLLWKFGYRILNEQNAWFFGVSAGDSQKLLDKKITDAHLYTGEAGSENKGFLGYNFHNQFVETGVQSGAIGALLLISIIISLVACAVRRGNIAFLLFTFMFFCFFLTESVLERQMGVVPFVLFSLIFAGQKKDSVSGN